MKQKGFTLMELMIVVAIVGVLAAIAYPSYQDSVRKSNRTDAKSALMGLKLAQERLRANCPTYAGNIDSTDDCAGSKVKGSATSSEGMYTLSVSGAAGTGYTLTATAKAGTIQTGDTGCTAMTLTISNAHPDGLKGPSDCW
jgi:type IV pilus assembly protein PilE